MKTRSVFISDIIFLLSMLSLLIVLRPDIVAIIGFVSIIPYIILTGRSHLRLHLLLALIMSSVWMMFAMSEYSYNQNMLSFYGIALLPLFSWAAGLFTIYVFFSHMKEYLKTNNFYTRFSLFLAIYWPLLIVAEFLGYHYLNVHNLAAAKFSGLPFLDAMHAAPWMQLAYFLIGPVFFLICNLIIPKKSYH